MGKKLSREIMDVPGVDIVIVGPNDMSGSASILGQISNPKMLILYDELAYKCKKAGMPFGVSLGGLDRASMKTWVERGVSIIGAGDDLSFILSGGNQKISYIRNLK